MPRYEVKCYYYLEATDTKEVEAECEEDAIAIARDSDEGWVRGEPSESDGLKAEFDAILIEEKA